MVATRSTRQTDGLVTDGEALSIPRSVNCWKVEYELTLSCVLAGAAQREQHDFTREQLVFLHPPTPMPPCIQLCLGNCLHLHSSPKAFPQPFPSWRSRCQTLKSKASSCFHYFMALSALTSCFPFSSPPPPGKERLSSLDLGPDPCVSVQVSVQFLCVMGTRDLPVSLGAWPGLLGARCLLLGFRDSPSLKPGTRFWP